MNIKIHTALRTLSGTLMEAISLCNWQNSKYRAQSAKTSLIYFLVLVLIIFHAELSKVDIHIS